MHPAWKCGVEGPFHAPLRRAVGTAATRVPASDMHKVGSCSGRTKHPGPPPSGLQLHTKSISR